MPIALSWSIHTALAAYVMTQISLNKCIQITIQHSLDIARFLVSPVIFDHLIGVQHIRPDLITPTSIHMVTFQVIQVLLVFFLLLLDQADL